MNSTISPPERFDSHFVVLALLTALMASAGTNASAQHAGDVRLSVPTAGGSIVTSGGEWVGQYAGRVFDEGVTPLSPPFITSSPGFDGPAGTFPASAVVRFDFVKQLLYWNGSVMATPAAAMTLDYQDTRFATITGTSPSGAPGFVISSAPTNGSFHEHLDYSLPSDAAAGLYGIVLTLGPGVGSAGFTSSLPFLLTFSQGSFADYQTGLSTMVDVAFAPVPEPSGVAVAAAVVCCGWAAARRARRSLVCRANPTIL